MIKVLLATANGAEREILSDFLLGMDIELINSPRNGDETMEIIRTVRPELCIIDLIMPKNSGLDILKNLQAMQHPPTVLILSPVTTKSFLERAIRLGATDILARPFSSQEFISTVLHCLDKAS